MSPSPPKRPKRLERLFNRIQGAFQPKSHPPSPPSRTPDPTEGNNSPSPRTSFNPNPPAIAPIPAQLRGLTGEPKAPSTSDAGLALSTVATASLATPATSSNKPSEAWSVARSGLEATLRVLEKTADAFPPLKSAVGGLVACLDVIQASYNCRYTTEDYV
jgi:hypothetical protein